MTITHVTPREMALQKRIQQLEAQIAAYQAHPPPREAYTQAELNAYAYGWWKALEVNRPAPASDVHGVPI